MQQATRHNTNEVIAERQPLRYAPSSLRSRKIVVYLIER